MTTVTLTEVETIKPIVPRSSRRRLLRLTINQYQAMAETGILRDDPQVELLGGVLVRQMTKNPPHNFTVNQIGKRLYAMLAPGWVVYEEKAVDLTPGWQPEPDVAVLIGPARLYETTQSTAADVILLVEVSDSSYAFDRGIKWRRYADVGVPTYWIVNLGKRQIEVYSRPKGKGSKARYAKIDLYGENDLIPVIINGQEVGRLDVGELLPRA